MLQLSALYLLHWEDFSSLCCTVPSPSCAQIITVADLFKEARRLAWVARPLEESFCYPHGTPMNIWGIMSDSDILPWSLLHAPSASALSKIRAGAFWQEPPPLMRHETEGQPTLWRSNTSQALTSSCLNLSSCYKAIAPAGTVSALCSYEQAT